MRQDIEFDAEGTTLRGWLYVPDNATGPAPTIVMCHGYSAVKELFLDAFAEVFCDAGFCALVYDNRNLGASDGEPRQEIDPHAQIADYRHAITFARSLDEVDGDRIGVWGSSYSGAHVLVVGAIDRRVKCVVAQVPLISGHENARRLIRSDLIAPTQGMFEADREARYRGEAPAMIPVVAPEGEPCALPTADSYEWFTTSGAERAPTWINECTLRSVEMFLEYEPGTYLPWISPTPLLMVVARGDHLTVSDLAIDAYERAREPKRLELLDGGHFDAYIAGFERSSGAARDWFVQHLMAGAREPAHA
jgi:fermentation-respiration switch protein FrsA (DUF1100 family)